LATARELTIRHPALRLAIVEKENKVGELILKETRIKDAIIFTFLHNQAWDDDKDGERDQFHDISPTIMRDCDHKVLCMQPLSSWMLGH
jgi:hypothetical protein